MKCDIVLRLSFTLVLSDALECFDEVELCQQIPSSEWVCYVNNIVGVTSLSVNMMLQIAIEGIHVQTKPSACIHLPM